MERRCYNGGWYPHFRPSEDRETYPTGVSIECEPEASEHSLMTPGRLIPVNVYASTCTCVCTLLCAGASPILGLECSGVVEAVGSHVERWRPGDEVSAPSHHHISYLIRRIITTSHGWSMCSFAPASQCLHDHTIACILLDLSTCSSRRQGNAAVTGCCQQPG